MNEFRQMLYIISLSTEESLTFCKSLLLDLRIINKYFNTKYALTQVIITGRIIPILGEKRTTRPTGVEAPLLLTKC